MQGKVCLVTGATSGIGQVAATELCRRGAHVVIVGRSAEKVRRHAGQIRAATGADRGRFIRGRPVVAGRESNVSPDQVRERYPRLDVSLNNAGAMFWKRARAPTASRRPSPSTTFRISCSQISSCRCSSRVSSGADRQRRVRCPQGRHPSISTIFNSSKSTAAGKPTSSRSSPTSCSLTSWRGASRGRA